MAYVTQHYLDYADHREEIETLNTVLADISALKPFPPELQETVERLIARVGYLMMDSKPKLSAYDQTRDRR